MWLLVLQARNVKQKNCIWKKNNKSGQMGFARFHCDRGCAERYNWQRQAVAVFQYAAACHAVCPEKTIRRSYTVYAIRRHHWKLDLFCAPRQRLVNLKTAGPVFLLRQISSFPVMFILYPEKKHTSSSPRNALSLCLSAAQQPSNSAQPAILLFCLH